MSRYCVQCGKAHNACICQWIKAIDSQVKVVILQHPSETKRPMGTAKILELSLEHCERWVGEDFSHHDGLNHLLQDPQIQPLVLYPNEHSIELNSTNQPQICRNPGQQVCLIILDGTWKKAYKMWQLSTNLHALPSIMLPNHLQGNYRIRKAPSEQHLSTVEAVFYALNVLDPDCDASSLMTTFINMIDFQIAQMPAGTFERNYR
ncbi:tRNA-uridine aminocarboxypropyltransferase [Vibrio aphrogenes]|uniref:tRNA-uridine aminocarboxypropyltransferase n=1 Tax=Vibrio aphrogenes TaxID=1891186 RepID=UPI000B364300|nr:DTW domain-containing protein [Vibrio aphrogenes]